MSPIVRVVRGRGRVVACQVTIDWAIEGHLAMGAYGIVRLEGLSLILPKIELILGTRGCYDYHHEPYR